MKKLYDINSSIIEENKLLKEQFNNNNVDFTQEDIELSKFKLEKYKTEIEN